MRFETFKSILLSVGICECEFYLRSSNKEGFIGYATEKDKKKYCVVFDNEEFYFDKDIDILTSKVINGKTLEEARKDAYENVKLVSFKDSYCRTDIGIYK